MITWDNLSEAVKRRNQHLREVLSGQVKKQAKYHNEKINLDGLVFDSKKEAAKYAELLLLKRAGIVAEFKHHPRPFVLKEGYRCQQTKRWIRPITYTPDFWVKYADGHEVWIDTKGYRTEVYRIKLKLFLERYPELEFIEE
ncbi:MAG: DUF1064 domain-containing protein [Negativicutes bacterium]|nr:DUF1064 domain-containing protein [Negativicutes bacterium]